MTKVPEENNLQPDQTASQCACVFFLLYYALGDIGGVCEGLGVCGKVLIIIII